jgi:hypothetical protein
VSRHEQIEGKEVLIGRYRQGRSTQMLEGREIGRCRQNRRRQLRQLRSGHAQLKREAGMYVQLRKEAGRYSSKEKQASTAVPCRGALFSSTVNP